MTVGIEVEGGWDSLIQHRNLEESESKSLRDSGFLKS